MWKSRWQPQRRYNHAEGAGSSPLIRACSRFTTDTTRRSDWLMTLEEVQAAWLRPTTAGIAQLHRSDSTRCRKPQLMKENQWNSAAQVSSFSIYICQEWNRGHSKSWLHTFSGNESLGFRVWASSVTLWRAPPQVECINTQKNTHNSALTKTVINVQWLKIKSLLLLWIPRHQSFASYRKRTVKSEWNKTSWGLISPRCSFFCISILVMIRREPQRHKRKLPFPSELTPKH